MNTHTCELYELDLIDYLDGTLQDERREALKAHLAVCEHCSRLEQEMREITSLSSELIAEVPEGLHEKIMDRVKTERPAGRLLRFTGRKSGAMIAAMLAVVIGVGMIFGAAMHGGRKDMEAEDVAYVAANAKSASTYQYTDAEEAEEDAVVAEECDDAAPMEACEEESARTTDAGAAKKAEDAPLFAAVYRMERPNMPDELQRYQLVQEEAESLLGDLPAGTLLAEVPAGEAETILEALDARGVAYTLDESHISDPDAGTVLFILYMVKE